MCLFMFLHAMHEFTFFSKLIDTEQPLYAINFTACLAALTCMSSQTANRSANEMSSLHRKACLFRNMFSRMFSVPCSSFNAFSNLAGFVGSPSIGKPTSCWKIVEICIRVFPWCQAVYSSSQALFCGSSGYQWSGELYVVADCIVCWGSRDLMDRALDL